MSFDISRTPSATSIATHIEKHASKDKIDKKNVKKEKSCFRHFSVDGPFNYAFIYGSVIRFKKFFIHWALLLIIVLTINFLKWEVVRARKVGTTHTALDYVVYRLFYAIILVGLTLFEIVKENDMAVFFCSPEVWVIIVLISYAFIFLQNVLAYNVHRENVKHRQKIPERLIVIDEIEKGGHKFYIYKRLSILPTDMLFNLEKVIYIMYNVVATTSVTIFVSILWGLFKARTFRCAYAAVMALADVLLVPIPLKLTHFIFPVAFGFIYVLFIYLIGFVSEKPLSFLESKGKFTHESGLVVARCILNSFIVHACLVGLGAFRDFVISLIDDSKTAKQQQSLRSQKRLARRRLMNFVEDEHGRMIGITLEKHSINDVRLHDEFIEKQGPVFGTKDETEESTSSEEEDKTLSKAPILTEIKPPPPARYPADDQLSGERFSSSSSDKNLIDDDMDALKNIVLPSPPGSGGKVDAETETERKPQKPSKIPLPLHKLGLQVKPRDSKEAIQEKLNAGALKKKIKGDDSPPTPPFVSLVQTMLKINQHKKSKAESAQFHDAENLADMFPDEYKRLIKLNQERKEKERELEQKKVEHLSKVQSQYKPRLSKSQMAGFKTSSKARSSRSDKKIEDGASGDKLLGSKVVFINKAGPIPRPAAEEVIEEKPEPKAEEQDNRFDDFHAELTKKLMLEKQRRSLDKEKMKYDAKIARVQAATSARKKRRETKKKVETKPKGILTSDRDDREERSQKRQEKIIKRRLERNIMGKRGKSVYDPLVAPKIAHETSFHILGTKFKQREAAANNDTQIKADMLPLYRQHPGIGTKTMVANIEEPKQKEADEGQENEETKAKQLVAFHPVVSYYDVNEVKPEKKRKPKYKF